MPQFTLFAKKLSNRDVAVYEDRELKRLKGTFPHETSGKYMYPRQGQKSVMLNCWRWNLVWVK